MSLVDGGLVIDVRGLDEISVDPENRVARAGGGLTYIAAPPEEFMPPEWQGKLVAVTGGMWNGPVEEGERALQALRDVAEPIADLYGAIKAQYDPEIFRGNQNILPRSELAHA